MAVVDDGAAVVGVPFLYKYEKTTHHTHSHSMHIVFLPDINTYKQKQKKTY